MFELVPLDTASLELIITDEAGFETKFGVTAGEAAEMLREVAQQTLDFIRRVPRQAPWGSYVAIDRTRRRVLGACSFKSAPVKGEVEIAYYTFPPHEGKGAASGMATELVRIALADAAVMRVVAHTMPEQNASGRVLEKAGFRNLGEVIDPEDGKVWRWERSR